eukprot:m.190591 g.190591  ORF g.190591 m.190591 type:complete len:350 (+) comp18565_c0_seq2:339-1388(+)
MASAFNRLRCVPPASTWSTCTRATNRNGSYSARRYMAVASGGGGVPFVFDRKAKRLQRDRAARRANVADYERLRNEVAWQISDRIQDIKRPFSLGLDLGCGRGHIGRVVDDEMVDTLVQSELARGPLLRFDADARDQAFRVQADEERMPFRDNMFDIVVSNLALHWVNDLPGCLTQIKNTLVPDGVFIGSMFGGDTLYELRCSLQLAEIERLGGFAPHVSPFADVRDCGSLLQRAGFTLLTVDIDEITVNYPSPMELLDDLQGMGEQNASVKRQPFLHSSTLAAAAAVYKEMYGNDDGTVPATFQIIYLLGWKPDPSQVGPAERGSATHSLKDLSVDLNSLQQSIQSPK